MLENCISVYIEDKQLDGAFKEFLCALSPVEQGQVSEIIENLSPSANTLREYLRLAREISKRDGYAFSDVLLDSVSREIISVKKQSRKERQKRYKLYLERKRFPIRAKIYSEISLLRSTLVEKHGIRIEIPEDLEGDTISIIINGRSKEDLRTVAQRLLQLAEDPDTSKVFHLLKGNFSEEEFDESVHLS